MFHEIMRNMNLPQVVNTQTSRRRAQLKPETIQSRDRAAARLYEFAPFRKKELRDLTPANFDLYILFRRQADASPSTINLEMRIARAAIKRDHPHVWSKLRDRFPMLPPENRPGIALTPEQSARLLTIARTLP